MSHRIIIRQIDTIFSLTYIITIHFISFLIPQCMYHLIFWSFWTHPSVFDLVHLILHLYFILAILVLWSYFFWLVMLSWTLAIPRYPIVNGPQIIVPNDSPIHYGILSLKHMLFRFISGLPWSTLNFHSSEHPIHPQLWKIFLPSQLSGWSSHWHSLTQWNLAATATHRFWQFHFLTGTLWLFHFELSSSYWSWWWSCCHS